MGIGAADRHLDISARIAEIDPGLAVTASSALERALEAVIKDSTQRGRGVGDLLIGLVAGLPEPVLAGPSAFAQRQELAFETRTDRPVEELTFTDPPRQGFSLDAERLLSAVLAANESLLALDRFSRHLKVPIDTLLGLRNLSSLVSSVMVASVSEAFDSELLINPHQDGYPDLLPKTPDLLAYVRKLTKEGRQADKAAWTAPGFGGVEVKATLGDTPPSRVAPKPRLGERRSQLVRSYNWKAHHTETTRLLACIWDFIDGVPAVLAVFWRNDLAAGDWGPIVSPRKGGGRTTSVSIMPRAGVKKMGRGWMVRTTDHVTRTALARASLM